MRLCSSFAGLKRSLLPVRRVTATFELMRRNLGSWDVVAQEWALESGMYLSGLCWSVESEVGYRAPG